MWRYGGLGLNIWSEVALMLPEVDIASTTLQQIETSTDEILLVIKN